MPRKPRFNNNTPSKRSTPPSQKGGPPKSETMRLQRYLAMCGLGARRKCEELITSGRISVDGEQVTQLGTVVNPQTQSIEMDTIRLKPERNVYYLLNKPKGVVCTNDDPEGRLRVVDMFPSKGPRLFPVGRLDEESEGLILVTNDGEFSHRLAHPKFRIYRTYHVHVTGKPTKEIYDQLKRGVYFAEGKFRVHDISRIRTQGNSTHVKIILSEGKNREIRRLLAKMGHKVMRLRRIGFGPVHLGDVKTGQYRPLTKEEIERLMEVVDRNEREKDYRPPRPEGRSRNGGSAGRGKTGSGRPGQRRTGNSYGNNESGGSRQPQRDRRSAPPMSNGPQKVRFVSKPRVVVLDDKPAGERPAKKPQGSRSERKPAPSQRDSRGQKYKGAKASGNSGNKRSGGKRKFQGDRKRKSSQ